MKSSKELNSFNHMSKNKIRNRNHLTFRMRIKTGKRENLLRIKAVALFQRLGLKKS
jgi:hypothetical protein